MIRRIWEAVWSPVAPLVFATVGIVALLVALEIVLPLSGSDHGFCYRVGW